MNKSYDVLRKEHETAVIESVKYTDKVVRLANSLFKRAAIETYKRALTFLHKGGWEGNLLVYIETVEKNRNGARVKVWHVHADGTVSHIYYNLLHPEQYFLAGPVIEDVNLLQEFIHTTLKEASACHKMYEHTKNVRSNSSNKT